MRKTVFVHLLLLRMLANTAPFMCCCIPYADKESDTHVLATCKVLSCTIIIIILISLRCQQQ